jgi:hypothetical protein
MTRPPIVILLSGWAGTGKDAAASLLADEMSFERIAFADTLKQDVSAVTGLPLDLFHNHILKDLPIIGSKTPRDLLLSHAAAARAVDPDIYIRKVAEYILDSCHKRFVISDWRYRRELEFLQKEFGPHVRIVRGRIERDGIVPSNDPSEHDLDDAYVEFTVENNGGLSMFRDEIKAAVRHVLYDVAL